jgi:transposase
MALGVVVTAAGTSQRDGAQIVLGPASGWRTWLRRLWVDGGYTGEAFAQWVKGLRPRLAVEVVKRSDATSGFKVLPHQWVVQSTLGWLMRHPRLVRDYQNTQISAQAWIYAAMIRIQLRRLA